MLEIPDISCHNPCAFRARDRRDHQICSARWAPDAAPCRKEIPIGDGSLLIERQHTVGEIILKHRARRRFEALAPAAVGVFEWAVSDSFIWNRA